MWWVLGALVFCCSFLFLVLCLCVCFCVFCLVGGFCVFVVGVLGVLLVGCGLFWVLFWVFGGGFCLFLGVVFWYNGFGWFFGYLALCGK